MFRQTAVALSLASVAALTAACSNSDAAAKPDASTSASAKAVALPPECENHPLLPAMPAAQTLAGKPLTEVDCQAFSVAMTYGEPGTSAKITLIDAQAPIPEDVGPMAGLLVAAQKTAYESVSRGVIIAKGMREATLSSPAAVASIGGENYLSVVMYGPTGEPAIISVEPKDAEGRVGGLMSALKGRYALTIGIEQDELSGAEAARAAYQPYFDAMRLNALP